MSKAKKKTIKPRPSVVQKAEQMRREGKASEARAYLKDNLKNLNKPGRERDYIDGLSVFSDLLRGTDDSAGSMKFLKKALQLAKKHDFQDLVGEITKKRAFLYLLLDQYRESFDDAQAALAISREQENKPLEIGALAVLGHLHEVRKERPKALVWFRQAMKLATEINDTWRRAGLYHDLGRIHGELREYLVGLDYLEQGEQYCLKHKYMNRYHMMIRAQGDIYKAIGDLNKAAELYERSQSDPEKIKNPSEALENTTRYGDLYVQMDRVSDALRIFKLGATLAGRFKFGRKLLQNYFGIARCHEQRQEFEKAFDTYKSIVDELESDFENNLSTLIAAFEMSAYVLHKLGEHTLADDIENFWRRFQALDDEGTYTAHRRADVRTSLIRQIPSYRRRILNAQIGIYEARGVTVDPETGIITIDDIEQPKRLSENAERKAFRFLKEHLDIPQEAVKIYGTYATKDQLKETKYIPGRVYALIHMMNKKGIPKELLYNVKGQGYILLSK